jgi:hypothetical protein
MTSVRAEAAAQRQLQESSQDTPDGVKQIEQTS